MYKLLRKGPQSEDKYRHRFWNELQTKRKSLVRLIIDDYVFGRFFKMLLMSAVSTTGCFKRF